MMKSFKKIAAIALILVLSFVQFAFAADFTVTDAVLTVEGNTTLVLTSGQEGSITYTMRVAGNLKDPATVDYGTEYTIDSHGLVSVNVATWLLSPQNPSDNQIKEVSATIVVSEDFNSDASTVLQLILATITSSTGAGNRLNYSNGQPTFSITLVPNQGPVEPIDPTVTWPTATMTFGEILADAILIGQDSSVPGTFTFDAPTTAPLAGIHSFAATFTPEDTDSYNTVSGTISVTVQKANPTVTWPAATMTFGETLADAILIGKDSSVPGTFTFDVPTTAPLAGIHSFAATFTPNDTDNYNTVSGTISVTVQKATPIVTWPTATMTFGETLADAILSGQISSVPGTFTFDAPTTAPLAGSNSFAATFTPIDTENYNTVSGTINVTATYNFGGILNPINDDKAKAFKAGSTIPAKFQLTDANGDYVSNAVARISYAKITNKVEGDVEEAVSTSAATSGNLFRYDTKDNQYIFNLSTKGWSAGTYKITIMLNDGETYSVEIGVK